MYYVDGFVLAVAKKKLAAYRKMALKASKVWMEHGALEYFECVGDDLKVEMGVSFPKLAKTKPSEAVIFSWIVYKSRSHRDAVLKKVMSDKRITAMGMEKMPFDIKRMTYGGFKTLVDVMAGSKKTAASKGKKKAKKSSARAKKSAARKGKGASTIADNTSALGYTQTG